MRHARRCALAVLAAGLLSPALARTQEAIAPGDSAKVATVEKLLAVSDMQRVYDQSVETSLAAQIRANPQLAPFEGTMRQFMAKYASYEAMKPDLIRIYRETLTESDVQQAIVFYQSPFGKRLMSRLPLILAKSSDLGAQRLQQHLPELMEMMQRAQQGASADSSAKAKPPRKPPAARDP